MTQLDDAMASMNRAQALLDQVVADNERLGEVLAWLTEAVDRNLELVAYVSGSLDDDVTAVLTDDPEGVTPPVANQDAAWEALVDHHDHLLRLLRVVTSAVTAELDVPAEVPGADDAD